jgi:hypothetical protein
VDEQLKQFERDEISGLLYSWENKIHWADIDFGPGRWSNPAMTMYDRASGFTWREIAERRARIMFWWDDHDVHVLEYPGGVIIPLWLQGKGLSVIEDMNYAREQLKVRRHAREAVRKVMIERPELEHAGRTFLRECLSTEEFGVRLWATAKEWIRPGER